MAYKMHQEPKELWTIALRSSQYEQGKYSLRQKHPDGDRLCCLAVACELAAARGIVKLDRDYYVSTTNLNDRSDCFLPIAVMQWLGLQDRMGEFFDEDGKHHCLSVENDEGNKSFAEIADLIDKHF